MGTQKAVKNIPKHLKRFTLRQNYKLYSPIDHAGWRFVMHLSQDFFKKYAHKKYLSGLPATGVTIDAIPRIEDMDKCLKKLGWRAAVVSGFIPPAIFLEFLSLGILPIACDMRSLGHLHYTPAPDIIHEAAGHAPILADPEYANYIRKYGEISQKVIFSAEDLNVYNAIRKLSDIKEDPQSLAADIAEAEKNLEEAVGKISFVSEATQLSRMAWWTIEYGLVGTMDNPLIYGAGLLSSVGESYDCFVKNVKKRPLTLDCINTSYDITKPQPHLFVTPNFQHLVDVLEEFSQIMAYRLSVDKALEKAIQARTVTTCQWVSQLQVSGVVEKTEFDTWSRPCFIQWKGPCQISFKNLQLKGLGPKRFQNGLAAVVGPMTTQSAQEFKKLKNSKGQTVFLEFESGCKLKGRICQWIPTASSVGGLLLQEAELNGRSYPEILVVNSDKIESVFGEAADRGSYYDFVSFMHEPNNLQKSNFTSDNKRLNELYAKIRKIRESKKITDSHVTEIQEILKELRLQHPVDWLSRIEIMEVLAKNESTKHLKMELHDELKAIERLVPDQRDLIHRGIQVFS